MDSSYYEESLLPFNAATQSAITMTTSYQALVPGAFLPIMGNNYFNFPGKAVRIRAYGLASTGTTPGALTFSLLYGTGANNNGTLMGGVAINFVASRTNDCWFAEFVVRCRVTGASGSLMGVGWFDLNAVGAVLLSPSSPAAATVDLTAATNVLTFQASRSGSTVETIQLLDIFYEALN